MNIHELGNAGFTSHTDGSGGIDSEIAREDRRRGRCWKDQDAWRSSTHRCVISWILLDIEASSFGASKFDLYLSDAVQLNFILFKVTKT